MPCLTAGFRIRNPAITARLCAAFWPIADLGDLRGAPCRPHPASGQCSDPGWTLSQRLPPISAIRHKVRVRQCGHRHARGRCAGLRPAPGSRPLRIQSTAAPVGPAFVHHGLPPGGCPAASSALRPLPIAVQHLLRCPVWHSASHCFIRPAQDPRCRSVIDHIWLAGPTLAGSRRVNAQRMPSPPAFGCTNAVWSPPHINGSAVLRLPGSPETGASTV